MFLHRTSLRAGIAPEKGDGDVGFLNAGEMGNVSGIPGETNSAAEAPDTIELIERGVLVHYSAVTTVRILKIL
jgi:hypothetical protein